MFHITGTFFKLKKVKQEKIINAALAEFAEQGYKKASTNRIVNNAGIAKGMLFYYFKNKKELYCFLVEYGLNFILEEYLSHIDESENDFIEKYNQAGRNKMRAYNKNPHIFNFFGNIIINEEELLPDDLAVKMADVKNQAFSKLFTNVDTTLFRKDISSEKIIKLIKWSMDGFSEEIMNRLKGKKLPNFEFEPLWDEFYDFLQILKKIYYK